jgi:hypothetical protein
MQNAPTTPRKRADEFNPESGRPTVIPTPRSSAMFPGWGVRF